MKIMALKSKFKSEATRSVLVSLVLASGLSACASLEQHGERMGSDAAKVRESFLYKDTAELKDTEQALDMEQAEDGAASDGREFETLQPLPQGNSDGFSNKQFALNLSEEPSVQLKVDKMPIAEFVHYALGELLEIEYVVDPKAQRKKEPVTFSSGGVQSPRRLYGTVMQVLGQNGLTVEIGDGVHYLYEVDPKKKGRGVTVNIGRDPDDVPRVAGDILQVVALKYGANLSLERTMRDLLDVKVSLDPAKNALFLQGARSEVIKALSFVEMFDAPANRGSHIGMVKLTYISSESFIKQISQLMEAEGIPVGDGSGSNKETVVVVPLPNIGSSAVFASTEELLNRVQYWARLLDQPAAGASTQYFVFSPKYARADEIGESLAELLGRRSRAGMASAGQNRVAGERTGQAPSQARSEALRTESFDMVVVERSNSLVFNTTGVEFQRLLPLLEQLDVLPKQVLLDVVIAEVTLKDEFKFGVEWAVTKGELTASTLGAFGASTIGGTALALSGSDGEAVSQLLQTSQLVNVLSNPTMLVRDGVQANINVGSDISVIGATTFDPLVGQRQTTSSVYRKTGVDVTVTPTVNAKGVILMKVDKKISNAVPNSSGAAGNPDVFERAISTEIVAGSGQTVLLGGLISEDITASGSGTPGLSSAPLIGWLFKSEGDSGSRTELVMLITARIIDDLQAWDDIKGKFSEGFQFLELSGE